MIAYDKKELINIDIRKKAKEAYLNGIITKEEMDTVYAAHPVTYLETFFYKRVLTTIFVFFAGVAVLGIIQKLFIGITDDGIAYLLINFVILIGLLILNKCIKNGAYKSGLDDGIIVLVVLLVSFSCFALLDLLDLNSMGMKRSIVLIYAFGMLYLAFRYLNKIAIIASVVLLGTTNYFYNSSSRVYMPFISLIVYSLLVLFIYHKTSLATNIIFSKVAKLFTCALLAYSYIYLVILQADVFYDSTNTHILPVVYWFVVFLFPILVLMWGLKIKEIIFIRLALLSIVLAVVKFRAIYHVIPIEFALTVLGIVLIAIAYRLIKYLDIDKHGFTFTPNKSAQSPFLNFGITITQKIFTNNNTVGDS